jgi:predicted RNA-binding protein with PUA-like domain
MPWLVKTEPETYSIDDLEREGTTRWGGVRNYQARNTMRDLMKVGDIVLIYHSNAEPPGVAGLARVSAAAIADATALDPKSPYFDPKATTKDPIWLAIEIEFVRGFDRLIPLEELRGVKQLERMALLQRGQRLSVQPVTPAELAAILERAGAAPSPRRTSDDTRANKKTSNKSGKNASTTLSPKAGKR